MYLVYQKLLSTKNSKCTAVWNTFTVPRYFILIVLMIFSKRYIYNSHEQLNGDDEEDDDIEEELENLSSDSDSDSEGKGQFLTGMYTCYYE